MKQFLLIFFCFFTYVINVVAQTKPLNNYERLVTQLESGYTDIDYTQFRKSFFESQEYAFKKDHITNFDSLKNEIETQAKNNKFFEVIKIGKAILNLDYTSMMAHQYLRQMYGYVHDSAREVKHKAIQYGLLRSMIGTGDGLSCNTAWEVFQTEEEYAILAMIGTKSVEHEIVEMGLRVCDKITVETKEGKERVYYFRIQKLKANFEEKKAKG